MSVRLCELLLSNSESFPELVDAVLPLLTKITRDIGLHLHLRDEGSDIIDRHPERLLDTPACSAARRGFRLAVRHWGCARENRCGG